MKEFIKGRSYAFYIQSVSFILGLIGLLSYIFANKATTGNVTVAYIIGVLALAALLLSILHDFYGICSIIAPALFVAAALFAFIDNATPFALALTKGNCQPGL